MSHFLHENRIIIKEMITKCQKSLFLIFLHLLIQGNIGEISKDS